MKWITPASRLEINKGLKECQASIQVRNNRGQSEFREGQAKQRNLISKGEKDKGNGSGEGTAEVIRDRNDQRPGRMRVSGGGTFSIYKTRARETGPLRPKITLGSI